MNSPAIEHDAPNPGESGDLLPILAARRWWLVASVILTAIAFGAVALLATPVYRSAAVLASASAARGVDTAGIASQLGGLASIAGIGLGSRDAENEEALAVFKSREFSESFITGHRLIPKLFANKWDAATGQWRAGVTPPTPAKAYKYFDTKVRLVTQDKKSGLVSVQIDWTNRQEAADWANELVRLLNEEMRNRAMTKADASMRFLEKELQSTSTTEARAAISRLMEAQVKQRMIANVTPDYSFRVVDRALPADADDPVWPKKLVLIALGPFAGLALGIVVVLLFARLGSLRVTGGRGGRGD